MLLRKKIKIFAPVCTGLTVLGILFSPGCGSDSSSPATTISGVVQLGPVDGAEVIVYKLNDDGTTGDAIAQTTTSSDGTYKITVADINSDYGDNSAYTGAVVIEAAGGSYTNEATGQLVERASTEKVRNAIGAMTAEGLAGVANGLPLTPLTECVVSRGFTAKQPGFDWAKALTAAKDEIKAAYGVDPNTMPANPANTVTDATSDSVKYMTALAGINEAAASKGVPPWEYVTALKNDASDGSFNGMAGASSVTFPSSTGIAFGSAPLTDIRTGMGNWDRVPPGVNSASDLVAQVPAFVAAPTNQFTSVTGYFVERDEFNPKYSKYLDPYNSEYKPLVDSHNGASYDGSKDPCNSSSAVYDVAKCPTNGAFNDSAFRTFATASLGNAGTYDPKTGTFTSPGGTVYVPGAGGAYVTPSGATVPPPNTSTTGVVYTGSFTPGTECANGTFYDPATKGCKAPGGTCPTGQYWDFPNSICKSYSASNGLMQWGAKNRLSYASMQALIFVKRLFGVK